MIDRAALNYTHRINRLSFGQDFPGLVSPLDNRIEFTKEGMTTRALAMFGKGERSCNQPLTPNFYVKNVKRETTATQMYQYFISIVPTLYKDIDGNVILTNQYTLTEHRRVVNHDQGSHGMPGMCRATIRTNELCRALKDSRRTWMHHDRHFHEV